MRRKAIVLIVSVATPLLLLALLGYHHFQANPVFEGKRISEWLNDLSTKTNRDSGNPAGHALQRAGPLAAPRLICALKGETTTVERFFRLFRAIVGGPGQKALDDPVFRADCAALLGKIRPTSTAIVDALFDAVRNGNAPVDAAAAMSLRRIARDDTTVAKKLDRLYPELMQITGEGWREHLEAGRVIRSRQTALPNSNRVHIAPDNPARQ